MIRKVQAIYEHGVLRPVEPVILNERQLVSVIILDDTGLEEHPAFASPADFEAFANRGVSIESVREALSPIAGELDRDFSQQREER
jgi:predicted DNA-binding antitoxin AbrB/MazE fold protein